MISTNTEISSALKQKRKTLNRKKTLMNKMNKINDSLVHLLKSKKLKRILLLRSLLSTILPSSPKTFEKSIVFVFNITTKTVYLPLIPLTIVNISIFVLNLSSAILFSIDKMALIVMALFYYLYSYSVLLYSSFFIETHITKVNISNIMIDNSFCNCWHQ